MLSRFVVALAALLAACPAYAHPHVFVTVKTDILFSPEGKIEGVRHAWTFDEFYSAFALQGLGTGGKLPTREELQPLAKINVESMGEFGFFTIAKVAGKALEFEAPKDYWLDASADKSVTQHFTLPLKEPASAAKAFVVMVYDPTYFVSFDFDETTPIGLIGAPKGCSAKVSKPPPLLAAESKTLSESFFSGLSPGDGYGIKLASRILVACP